MTKWQWAVVMALVRCFLRSVNKYPDLGQRSLQDEAYDIADDEQILLEAIIKDRE